MSTASDGVYLLGIDVGTESVRAGVFTPGGQAMGLHAVATTLSHPRPGWGEQDPDEWWSSLVAAVRGALAASGVAAEAVAGIASDCTASTVVAVDADGRHLRPAIMWMDVRGGDQARRMTQVEHPARRVNAGGTAPVPAEWFPPKALWLKEHEPQVYQRARYLAEATDWLTHRLTGRWTASANCASLKAYWDREWPADFYARIGLDDLVGKLPVDVLALGAQVGGLTPAAAQELGLRAGTPVAQGGCDAFVGQIGLGVVQPGRMALIAGSSHVLIGQSDQPVSGRGFFGGFVDAVVPGQETVEGGGASTGSVLRWFVEGFCGEVVAAAEAAGRDPYDVLNERARAVPPGSDGLIVCDYWQGNRTPFVDPDARGMIWGLTLSHTPIHVYRAVQEGVCYGTAHTLRAMAQAGFGVGGLVMSGGVTNSPDWVQLHADVTGVPITLTKVTDSVVLGAAILAAAGAGLYPSVTEAVAAMVHDARVVEPDPQLHDEYRFYVDAYAETLPRMAEPMHAMVRRVASSPSAGPARDEEHV